MRRPLIVAALRLLSLALVDRGAAVARVGAPVCVKEIVDTTRNDAGQAISLPHGPLQLVVSIYTPAPGAKTARAQASVPALRIRNSGRPRGRTGWIGLEDLARGQGCSTLFIESVEQHGRGILSDG